MLIYLLQTVWSLATTTDYERQQPTHTNRLLDQSSYNPISHKATTTRILTRRAQLVCDSPESLQDETDYLNTVLVKTNTTRTLSDETLTVTLTPKLRPTSTLALLRQRLYRTSEAPLNYRTYTILYN